MLNQNKIDFSSCITLGFHDILSRTIKFLSIAGMPCIDLNTARTKHCYTFKINEISLLCHPCYVCVSNIHFGIPYSLLCISGENQ